VLEAHRTLRAFKEEVQKAKLVTEVPPTAVRKKGR
jgi:ribosomal protein S21